MSRVSCFTDKKGEDKEKNTNTRQLRVRHLASSIAETRIYHNVTANYPIHYYGQRQHTEWAGGQRQQADVRLGSMMKDDR